MLNFFFKKIVSVYLLLAALGLHRCTRVFSSCGELGLLSTVQRRLTAVASLVVEHGLQGEWALEVGVHRLSCSMGRGIFPDQGLNLCPTALAVEFLTTDPLGNSAHFLI